MKKILIAFLIISILLISACNSVEQNTEQNNVGAQDIDTAETEEIEVAKEDFSDRKWDSEVADKCIPDAETAIRVGEAYLKAVFDESRVEEQQPLTLGFDEELGLWGVFGTVGQPGGNIAVYLDMKDGRVLQIIVEE